MNTVRKPRRLLSIGHSYVVSLNRRLAAEMSQVSGGSWEVTTVAPKMMHGELGRVCLDKSVQECRVEPVSVYGSRHVHFMTYETRIKSIMDAGWDLVHAWEEPYVAAG